MTVPEGADEEVRWRKSNWSGEGQDCVEVAEFSDGEVAIRDSKAPEGGYFKLPRAGFRALTKVLKPRD